MGKKSRTDMTHHRSNHLYFDDEVKIRLRLLGHSSPSSFLRKCRVGSGDALGRRSQSSVTMANPHICQRKANMGHPPTPDPIHSKPANVCGTRRLSGNVRQPNHVLADSIAGNKAERRSGAGEEWLAPTKHDGVQVKSILINKTKVG